MSCTQFGLLGDDGVDVPASSHGGARGGSGPAVRAPASLGAGIPKRSPRALRGSQFVRQIQHLSGEARERAIARELRAGNIPGFLRELKPLHVSAVSGGRTIHGTLWVMPDYLAIGSNEDYVYIPMTPGTAQGVAEHFGFVMPTPKLVDAIYAQAKFRLTPMPLKAGPQMVGTEYYRLHNSMVQRQIGSRAHGALVAGHKKDVVVTNRLCRMRRRVAIYGWHRGIGAPIQPLSLVHGDSYADYSHGIRLIAARMVVDGVELPVASVMQNPRYAPLVSNEGVLRQTRAAPRGGC